MKQIVRLNTFETNSSSTHSLVVPKEIKNIEKIKDIQATIHCGEFGWGYDEYSTFGILSYLWTGLQGSEYEHKLRKLFPKCTFVPFELYEDGYIDHQSRDLPFTIIEQPDDVIYNIVENGTLYVYNDNSDYEIHYDKDLDDRYDS